MPHSRPLVLLVDNHADTRDMYSEYLRLREFRVIACSDSRMSVDLARSCAPDIILLELRMTGMNGAEALARLRHEDLVAAITRIIDTARTPTVPHSALRADHAVVTRHRPAAAAHPASAVAQAPR